VTPVDPTEIAAIFEVLEAWKPSRAAAPART